MSNRHHPRIEPSEQAIRAARYYTQQAYEATRGFYTAYVVDSGDNEAPLLPAWGDLTERQRELAFGVGLSRESRDIIDSYAAVGLGLVGK